MIKSTLTLMDLTTTEELNLIKKFPNIISLLPKAYVDLTLWELHEIAESHCYSIATRLLLINMFDHRYEAAVLHNWKPE